MDNWAFYTQTHTRTCKHILSTYAHAYWVKICKRVKKNKHTSTCEPAHTHTGVQNPLSLESQSSATVHQLATIALPPPPSSVLPFPLPMSSFSDGRRSSSHFGFPKGDKKKHLAQPSPIPSIFLPLHPPPPLDGYFWPLSSLLHLAWVLRACDRMTEGHFKRLYAQHKDLKQSRRKKKKKWRVKIHSYCWVAGNQGLRTVCTEIKAQHCLNALSQINIWYCILEPAFKMSNVVGLN